MCRSTGLGSGVLPLGVLSALRCVESTSARDISAARPRVTRRAGTHATPATPPASCRSVNRRQHVSPEAPNNRAGNRFQPISVRTTYRMSSSAARSSTRLRPGYLKRRGGTGTNGSNRTHNSSVTNYSHIRQAWNTHNNTKVDTPTHSEPTSKVGLSRLAKLSTTGQPLESTFYTYWATGSGEACRLASTPRHLPRAHRKPRLAQYWEHNRSSSKAHRSHCRSQLDRTLANRHWARNASWPHLQLHNCWDPPSPHLRPPRRQEHLHH